MNCLDHAQEYIRLGYSVVPLRLDGTKRSAVQWKKYQKEIATVNELERWFRGDQRGLAVVTGEISGNLVVIDFDADADEYFPKFWQEAQRQLPGVADKLIVVKTPRPGRQIWFRMESKPPANQAMAYTEPRKTGKTDDDGQPILKPRVMIEIRGTGGYVCAVGTPAATHKTGRRYQLTHGSFDFDEIVSAEEADAMFAICRGYTQYVIDQVEWTAGESYQGEPRPGNIFNQHVDIRELLIQAGWQSHHSGGGETVEHFTRPGKLVTDGHSATLGYIRSDDGKPLLYVFSSNAWPFEQHKCYDAFGAYALLHHNGNFSKAASAARIEFSEQLKNAKIAFHEATQAKKPTVDEYVPFPTHLMPEVVHQYVEAHAKSIGIDPAFVAVPMLAVLAGLIGQARQLALKSTWHIPSILWTATIGEVSCGKTPGWQAAIAPAERIEHGFYREKRRLDEDFNQRTSEYKRAIAGGNRAAEKPIKTDFKRQFLINDATMEVLVDVHGHNSKMLLACDELAGWVRAMDMYRGGTGRDMENWLSIYNGGSMQVNRKTDNYRVYLSRTSISVTGTIQPETAAKILFTEKLEGNGFAARVLLVQPPPAIVLWSDSVVSAGVNQQMFDLAERMYCLPQSSVEGEDGTTTLVCDDAARAAFIEFYDDAARYAEGLEPAVKSAWLKLRPVAARFALIFSVVEQLQSHPAGQATQPVDAKCMGSGIELAYWFGRELERIYAINQTPAFERLIAWIRAKHADGVDARALQTGRREIKTAEDARATMQELVEVGYGKMEGKLFVPSG